MRKKTGRVSVLNALELGGVGHEEQLARALASSQYEKRLKLLTRYAKKIGKELRFLTKKDRRILLERINSPKP
jgi:hypothetical protein